MWCSEINVHVATNDAKYGDNNNQDATITTNDVLTFENINLKDLFFKNATAGSNTTIYAICIKMLPGEMKRLGVS